MRASVSQVIEEIQDSKMTLLKQESPEKIEVKEKSKCQTQHQSLYVKTRSAYKQE